MARRIICSESFGEDRIGDVEHIYLVDQYLGVAGGLGQLKHQATQGSRHLRIVGSADRNAARTSIHRVQGGGGGRRRNKSILTHTHTDIAREMGYKREEEHLYVRMLYVINILSSENPPKTLRDLVLMFLQIFVLKKRLDLTEGWIFCAQKQAANFLFF